MLDEPTNHLDIHYQLDILELVRSLGITTLVTVHDLNLAAAYCDRLYVLSAGTIVAEGTPEQVLTPHWLRDIFGQCGYSTPSRYQSYSAGVISLKSSPRRRLDVHGNE